jgi:3-hydroxyacyl-CoA dehydrogenase
MSTAERPQLDEEIAERFTLKAIVEACLVLEEGIAGVREIDLGLMMGTGMVPGPFARADFRGLDDVLAALERAEREWGEHFAPPLVLRRLVAQGRLGAKSGQGFYPYPQPESGYENAPVKLDRRGADVAVLWLDNPPANSLSAQVIEALEAAWREVEGSVKAVILAPRTRRCSAPAPTSRRSRRWTRAAAGSCSAAPMRCCARSSARAR